MKKFLTAASITLLALAPAVTFAQANDDSSNREAATYTPASGGSAGASAGEVAGYTALAVVGAGAAIGAAFAVANSGSDDENVDLNGATGTTGTTGTTN
ncbi:hypothetical protein [Salinisphaera sp.]|uniref:hypothetical protein n=1 Tax=Salinisphaera sp. TaxID=1914330 RepID=UPI000C5DFA3E|nr:hypothetical protein [Salinisphaera sp.]MAS08586.1 hypothetical protein [Salinisphaera sp.]|tara:strand:- start:4383 stop:4679 length:297 start_codon:yes stop_codon:yes gene_type:complete